MRPETDPRHDEVTRMTAPPARPHPSPRPAPDHGRAPGETTADGAPAWSPDGAHGARLLRGGQVLAEYRDGSDMAQTAAPRPYLHPVRTAGGVPLTDVRPADHVHHVGVSMALPVVNGTSFWGGRTYVRGRGSTLLDNHGRQEPVTTAVSPGAVTQELRYRDRAGDVLLTERRRLAHALLPDGGWALGWTSDLTAGAADVRFDSPATNGRAGAGYGGILWRLGTADGTTVLSAGGAGEAVAHGSTSPWVAFVQRRGARAVTLVLAQPGPALPWFLRATEYDGACPAVAWDHTRVLPAGAPLRLGLVGAAVDTALDVPGAAALAARAQAALAPGAGRGEEPEVAPC